MGLFYQGKKKTSTHQPFKAAEKKCSVFRAFFLQLLIPAFRISELIFETRYKQEDKHESIFRRQFQISRAFVKITFRGTSFRKWLDFFSIKK